MLRIEPGRASQTTPQLVNSPRRCQHSNRRPPTRVVVWLGHNVVHPQHRRRRQPAAGRHMVLAPSAVCALQHSWQTAFRWFANCLPSGERLHACTCLQRLLPLVQKLLAVGGHKLSLECGRGIRSKRRALLVEHHREGLVHNVQAMRAEAHCQVSVCAKRQVRIRGAWHVLPAQQASCWQCHASRSRTLIVAALVAGVKAADLHRMTHAQRIATVHMLQPNTRLTLMKFSRVKITHAAEM